MTKLSTKFVLFFTAAVTIGMAQTKSPTPSIEQKAEKGMCVNVVALTGNVNLNCSSLTPDQSKSLLAIQAMLRKMVANQIDPNVINQMNLKLDEILTTANGKGSLNQSNSGGINIQQGTTGAGSPIVNSPINVGLYPPRHISSEWVEKAIPFLSATPSKALVLYQSSEPDGFTYAKEISDMLKKAGWTVEGPSGAMIMSEGAPLYGISIAYKGEKVGPGQMVKYDSNSGSGRLLAVFMGIQKQADIYADPNPGADEDKMTVTVNTNPSSKPPQ